MKLKILAPIFILSLLAKCTPNNSQPDEIVNADSSDEERASEKKSEIELEKPTRSKKRSSPESDPIKEESCLAVEKIPEAVPFFFAPGNFMVTRITKNCVTQSGRSGYFEDASWMAMGIPCTGSPGIVEIEGTHYASPRMVSFHFDTACGMNPPSKQVVSDAIVREFEVPALSKLIAYTPFVLQYWEVPGYSDADIGVKLELRSQTAKDQGWKLLREGSPLTVYLFGRENTWIQSTKIYFVEAKIRLTSQRNFQIDIVQAKPLSSEEIEEVKTRCEALQPKRGCGHVF